MKRFEERILSRIAHGGSGCWRWTGQLSKAGYGVLNMYHEDGKRRNTSIHRIVYREMIGDLTDGLALDHLCRNRWCVNPTHLEEVTLSENLRRGLGGILKTHCKNGHPYEGDNIRLRTTGERRCYQCHKTWSIQAYAKLKARLAGMR